MDCAVVYPQAVPDAAGAPAALLPPARSPYHLIMYGSEGSDDSARVDSPPDASSTLSDLSRRLASMALDFDGDDDLSVDAQPVPGADTAAALWAAGDGDGDDAALLLLAAAAVRPFELEDRLAGYGAAPVPPGAPATSWRDAAPFVPDGLRARPRATGPPPALAVGAAESASATPGSPHAARRRAARAPEREREREKGQGAQCVGEVCMRFCTGTCTRGRRCRLLHIYEDGAATARDGTVHCRSRFVDVCCRADALALPPAPALCAAAPRLAREPSGCLLLDLVLRAAPPSSSSSLAATATDVAAAVLADTRTPYAAMARCSAGRRALQRIAALAPPAHTPAVLGAVRAVLAAAGADDANGAVAECAVRCAEAVLARSSSSSSSDVAAVLVAHARAVVRCARGCRLLVRTAGDVDAAALAGALATDGVLADLITHSSSSDSNSDSESDSRDRDMEGVAGAVGRALAAGTAEQQHAVVLAVAAHADVLLRARATAPLVLGTVAARVREPGVAAAAATALADTLAALTLDAATAPLAERLVLSHDRAAQRTLVHALIRDDTAVRAMLAAPPAAPVLQAALVNVTARQYLHLAAALNRHRDLLDTTPTGRAVAARMTRAVTNGSRPVRNPPAPAAPPPTDSSPSRSPL